MEKKQWHNRVVHFVVPHEGNGYRPKILRASVLGVILLIALALQALYVIDERVVMKTPNFLAAVLPGVLVTLANEDRADNGLGTLEVDPLLVAAAQLKANDMAEKGYFAHETPEGYQPWHFLKLVGYNYEAAGENLAVNFSDSDDVQKAWMNSPGHRENLLRSSYTHVGIATAVGTYKGKEAIFVAQFFGRPVPTPIVIPPLPQVEIEPSAKPTPVPTPTLVPAPAPLPVLPKSQEPAKVVVADIEPTTPLPPEQVAVLVADAAPTVAAASSVGLFEEVVASPLQVLVFFLAALSVIVTCMLAIAVVAHLKLPYVEALGGTLALLIVIIGLLTFNTSTIAEVEVPANTQAASVILSL
jgi:hypothetical protein